MIAMECATSARYGNETAAGIDPGCIIRRGGAGVWGTSQTAFEGRSTRRHYCRKLQLRNAYIGLARSGRCAAAYLTRLDTNSQFHYRVNDDTLMKV